MVAFSLGVSPAVIIVVFLFSIKSRSFLCVPALQTPPLGGGGRARFPGSCGRRIAGRYACPAHGQVSAPFAPSSPEIRLDNGGFCPSPKSPHKSPQMPLHGVPSRLPLLSSTFGTNRLTRPSQGLQTLTSITGTHCGIRLPLEWAEL